ncbi:MAG: hypothetical protein M1819_002704 [Sarea resinae]|nr:MAG: hypothetical protein M1819_002704 [Sarea resinae]
MDPSREDAVWRQAQERLSDHACTSIFNVPVLPPAAALEKAQNSLRPHLPTEGLGLEDTVNHLFDDVVPGFNGSSLTPNYYGFVTGGVTAAAGVADRLVSTYDQNVQVHLPHETISTVVEDRALVLLLELLDLKSEEWPGRTFTTGATASNVLGLACGREHAVAKATARRGEAISIAEDGLIEVMLRSGLRRVQILTTAPHSSLRKAASVVGLGRASVKDVGNGRHGLKFDFGRLESALSDPQSASIVVISCGEVNTGLFATTCYEEFKHIRDLCDEYGAWLHVDGAFGLFGRLLRPSTPFAAIHQCCAGMELADSLTGDAHKFLNVPYDCGFFLTRHASALPTTFQNPSAAYLATSSASAIPSPLNTGIENSRRFRALPVYATLLSYGISGYRSLLETQITLARKIADFVLGHAGFELLASPAPDTHREDVLADVYIIVLFRAKDEGLNNELVARINGSKKIYVSGTKWEGRPAARIAVSHCGVEVSRDFEIVKGVLEGVVTGWKE